MDKNINISNVRFNIEKELTEEEILKIKSSQDIYYRTAMDHAEAILNLKN